MKLKVLLDCLVKNHHLYQINYEILPLLQLSFIKARFSCVRTCQPIPRLRIEGGNGVALAYLYTAMKAPVDCVPKETREYIT